MGEPSGKMEVDVLRYLKKLEARISRIERVLEIQSSGGLIQAEPADGSHVDHAAVRDNLEFEIGQFWFAKVGIIVLAVGIIFLLTFPYRDLPPVFPSLLGLALVGVITAISHFLKKSYGFLADYFLGGGLVLLYFSALRLSFFAPHPALANSVVESALLLVAVVINLAVAIHKRSLFLAGIGITLGYLTAILSEYSYFTFTLIAVAGISAIYISRKNEWPKLVIYAIVLAYLTHFFWFLNNPFLGNSLQFVSSQPANLLFLMLYALIFALGSLYRITDFQENSIAISSAFLNAAGFYLVFLLETITSFRAHIAIYQLATSGLFLVLSIIYWVKERSKYATFFYAMLGYMALSVAIIFRFHRPDFFVWLSWQSLLVIVTAIWFRSKIIIVANFFIYLLIFLSYLVLAGRVGVVSLSFGIVALLSARILNWKKHRLELKTEMMRNAYLVSAFFIFPYALYHSAPADYIGLSWMAVAIFYYLMGRLLNNKKYRWMALLTLLLTVLYIFIIGIAKLPEVYRIISFLLLGIILVIVSIVYAKMRAKIAAKASSEE